MSDSEKNKDQVGTENPPDTTAIVLTNQYGAVRQQLKDKSGKFVRKPKPLTPTIEFTRKERKILMQTVQDGEMTEHEKAFRNLLRIAQNTDDDPKAMMAAAKAYEVVMLRALGKPAPSEQEMDKLTTQPFTTIYIPVPQIMHPEIQEYKPADEKKQPSFIDAEVIQQNKK